MKKPSNLQYACLDKDTGTTLNSQEHSRPRPCRAMASPTLRLDLFTAILFFPLGYVANSFSARRGCTRSGAPLPDVESDVAAQLYSPPAHHGNVAVPSVFSDARGQVHNVQFGGFRFNVLVSEPGTLRSGDVHRADQLDMIFEGLVRVTTRENGRDVEREYGAGELVIVPANTPHIFKAVNRTVMAEWWRGGSFEARYYRPYRKQVDEDLEWRNKCKDLLPMSECSHAVGAGKCPRPHFSKTCARSCGICAGHPPPRGPPGPVLTWTDVKS